jgi:hypothetical protein
MGERSGQVWAEMEGRGNLRARVSWQRRRAGLFFVKRIGEKEKKEIEGGEGDI